MSVEITAPEEFQGAVTAHVNKCHGIITGTDSNLGWFTVYCEVSETQAQRWYIFTLLGLLGTAENQIYQETFTRFTYSKVQLAWIAV